MSIPPPRPLSLSDDRLHLQDQPPLEEPFFTSYRLTLNYKDTWGHVIDPKEKGYQDTAFRFLDRYLQLRMTGNNSLPFFVDIFAGRQRGETDAEGENWRTALYVKWDVEGSSEDHGVGVDGVLLGGGLGLILAAPEWEPSIWKWHWGFLEVAANYRQTVVESTMAVTKAKICASFKDEFMPCNFGGDPREPELADLDLTDTVKQFAYPPNHTLGIGHLGTTIGLNFSRIGKLALHADGVMLDGAVVMKPREELKKQLEKIPASEDEYNLRDGKFGLVLFGVYGLVEGDLSLANLVYWGVREAFYDDENVWDEIETEKPLPFDLRATFGTAIFVLIDEAKRNTPTGNGQETVPMNVTKVINFFQLGASASLILHDSFFDWIASQLGL